MTLPAPQLDARRYDDLIKEAQERIPRFTPEWTNFNPSDPGMTLVQLYAWISETILYDLNRVPDLNYIKFLNLLGVTPRPAQPARAEVTFTLEDLGKPDDPLTVAVPRQTAITVDDPDLPEVLTFETDRSLVAINAHIGGVIAPYRGEVSLTRKLVTRYEEGTTWLHTFDPFSDTPTQNDCLYLSLLLRPILKNPLAEYSEDVLPAGPLDIYIDALQVYDRVSENAAELGDVFAGPASWTCADKSAPHQPALIEWQIFTGNVTGATFPSDSDDTGWKTVATSRDDTNCLTRSGHVTLELPAGAVAVNPTQFSGSFWETFGEARPPQSKTDLIAALRNGTITDPSKLGDLWDAVGLPAGDLSQLEACADSAMTTADKLEGTNTVPGVAVNLTATTFTMAQWADVSDAYAVDLPMENDNYRKTYLIRARLTRTPALEDLKPRKLQAMRLNTASTTQAATILEERLGVSTGRPAQSVSLRRTPVLMTPVANTSDLTLALTGADNVPFDWTRVDDFYRSGPADPHYMLDPINGLISFGDGRRGQIPVGGSRFMAQRYRVGGGAVGNVAPGKITKIKGRVRGVKEATNYRPAHDGADAETVEAAKARAPHDLRSRDRAVSADDFRELAMQTPGVNLHKVFAIPRKALAPDGTLAAGHKDGAVTLVVLPNNDQAAPQPSEDQHRAICRWLEPRRLITTELYITGPQYSDVTRLSANITVADSADLSAVTEAIYARLLTFMHPIHGGEDGTGWPFGGDIYHGDLYEQMLGVQGVRRVTQLAVATDGTLTPSYLDFTVIAEGYLPVLTRDAINLVASYAT